jgi:dihydroorotase
MTLYLSPDLTPEEVRRAKEAGITGVKSYPRGVTTNSDGGIESYEVYYPVFEEMQKCDLVLNLHGEVPSDAASVSRSRDVFTHTVEEDTPEHLRAER